MEEARNEFRVAEIAATKFEALPITIKIYLFFWSDKFLGQLLSSFVAKKGPGIAIVR